MPAWIGPLAIIAVGLLAWWYNQRLASLRATIDYISNTEGTSEQWFKLRTKFSELMDQGSLVSLFGKDESEEKTEEVATVCTFLNHFELTSVGIKHKILNENLYREWFRGSYIKIWRDSNPFISELRKRRSQPKLFIEFEDLATSWEENKKAG